MKGCVIPKLVSLDHAKDTAAGARGLRELRLVIPDPHSSAVRRRVAASLAKLDPRDEEEAMRWIEAVSASR
jgi:hypothetical protein